MKSISIRIIGAAAPVTIALLAPLLAAVPISCATARPPAPARAASSLDQTSALDPDSAAARALAVSPRVEASRRRLDALTLREATASVPPDPSIAISFGVPIDGMGGSPLSLSIMEGIGWLLRRDAIRSAAERERELATRELVATSVAVAAEARGLTRALAMAREASMALADAAEARATVLAIEQARLDLRESTAVEVRAREAEAQAAREAAITARLEEHELGVSLASLLAVESVGPIEAPDVAGPPDAIRDSVPTTLEVVRARARLARAEAALAAVDTALGADPAIGGGVSRDIEDRDSATATLQLTLPLFRRGDEIAALRAEVEAERSEAMETERIAAVELSHAWARAVAARELVASARASALAARHAREIAERAFAEGEASRAQVAVNRALDGEAAAREAVRRIELARAVSALETRTIPIESATKEAKP